MKWSQKYRKLKDTTIGVDRSTDYSVDALFHIYCEKLSDLYNRFNEMIDGSFIQSKLHKFQITIDHRGSFMAEKEKVDAFILSDNENELKFIPEGTHYIGVMGKVAIKAYRKVYTFNTIRERKLKSFKEPYLLLVQDENDKEETYWGYIKEEENAFFGHEIKRLDSKMIEKLLDEVFLSS